jgi:hypothetical protein
VVGSRGNGTLNVSGTGRLDAGNNLRVAGSWENQTLTGRVNQTGGTVLATNVQIGNSNGTGIYNLEGGTLRLTTLNNFAGPSSALNWGAGSLSARQFDSGTATGADLSAGTGFTQIRNSTTAFNANASLTTGYAGNVNAASRLDLGGIYLSAGSTVFDHLTVGNGRTLNLASNADILEFNDDTAYLLRPFGFFTEDYASLPLVTTTGGGTITGTFDTFLGLSDDGRGWSQYTGVFTSASALPVNTWYLQQTSSAITFHYKITGFVPEPGTFGLMAIGAFGLRLMRRSQKNFQHRPAA